MTQLSDWRSAESCGKAPARTFGMSVEVEERSLGGFLEYSYAVTKFKFKTGNNVLVFSSRTHIVLGVSSSSYRSLYSHMHSSIQSRLPLTRAEEEMFQYSIKQVICISERSIRPIDRVSRLLGSFAELLGLAKFGVPGFRGRDYSAERGIRSLESQ